MEYLVYAGLFALAAIGICIIFTAYVLTGGGEDDATP